MIRFFGALCLFTSSTIVGQNYKVIDTADYTERSAFVKEFKQHNALFMKDIKTNYSGKTAKDLLKIYKEFEDIFVEEVNDKNFTFKSGLENFIQDIISDLRKSNSNVPDKIRVLISKNNYPNAFCLADGTFVINMGLFNWTENKDQMASIIAHELAHNILKHNLKLQVKAIAENRGNTSEIQQIKEQKFNKSSKAFEYLKNQLYEKSELKRKHEVEADSLGYILYKNAKFKEPEFVNALRNLVEFDTISPIEIKIETYKNLFDLPAQKFNEAWLKTEDFTAYNYDGYKEKIDKDSIASHPETADRILKLKSFFKELEQEQKATTNNVEYNNIKNIARMEILPNFFHLEEFGVGIYAGMHFVQESENSDKNVYYKEWLGKYFEKIYQARKEYKLNRYVDVVNPKDQNKSYQLFLNFIWNLKLDEIKNIADYYTKK